MINFIKIVGIVFFILLISVISIAFSFKKEILSTFNVFKYYIAKDLSTNSNEHYIDSTLHDLNLSKISISSVLDNYDYSKVNSPVGFLESFENRLFFISNKGQFFEITDFEKNSIQKLDTNFDLISESENFVKTMGVRGILFDKNDDKLYVSYIYNDKKTNCTGVALISSEINNFINISFKEIFKTKCIKYKNLNDFNEMSSGGKIISLNSENLLLTVGDFWQNNISQISDKEYGKILKINKITFDTNIYSMGHRNPQGITKMENKIFATEHGPRGGDEINLIVQDKNYGWPEVAYGPTYKKDYSKYHLKNHKNFEEPILAFAPSIGISDIEYYNKNYFKRWKGDLLVASMKNNTGMIELQNPGLSLYRIKLNKNRDKIIYQEKIYIGDRIRDIEILSNGEIFLITEENPSIFRIKKQ